MEIVRIQVADDEQVSDRFEQTIRRLLSNRTLDVSQEVHPRVEGMLTERIEEAATGIRGFLALEEQRLALYETRQALEAVSAGDEAEDIRMMIISELATEEDSIASRIAGIGGRPLAVLDRLGVLWGLREGIRARGAE